MRGLRLLPIAVAIAGITSLLILAKGRWTAYGGLAVTWLTVKLICAEAASTRRRRPTADTPDVLVVVAGYNEDVELWRRALRSVAAQTLPPKIVVAVDDGTPGLPLAEAAEALRDEIEAAGATLYVVAQDENLGKRQAISDGVRIARIMSCELVITIDSDTIMAPDCVANLIRPFADPLVNAATGNVSVLNRRSLLSRLIDVRYCAAFEVDRAWQSTFSSMLCCCGSASAYRTSAIEPLLHDGFLHQTWRSRRCTYGDDRRLTALALRDRGKAVYCPTARAWTAAPERLGHWWRQQVRWQKSWLRETWLLLVELTPRRAAWWIALSEASMSVAFTLLLWISIGAMAVGSGLWLQTLAAATIISMVRAAPFLARQDMPLAERLLGVALSPAYTVLHVVTAVPIRLTAAATLNDTSWGTRRHGVEVTA